MPEKQVTVLQTSETSLVERGQVSSVGSEVKTIKPGDTVLFTSFGVDSIDVDGERNYFLLEDDAFILATHELGGE